MNIHRDDICGCTSCMTGYKKETCEIIEKHTCESLFPRSIMDAALDAAFSCASIRKAMPTSARAKDGASFMPSPTFEKVNLAVTNSVY